MRDEPSRPEIVNDLALLYELSLSVGTSLHLETNCDTFLKTLQRRKNLDYYAVWIRDPYPKEGEAGFRLVYSGPSVRSPDPWLSITHPLVEKLADHPCFSMMVRDRASLPYVTEDGLQNGCMAVFNLGDIGLLKIHASHRSAPFHEREMKQLQSVLSKFGMSLEGCLAHQQLVDEIQERRRTQRELGDLKKFYEQVLDAMPAQLAVFDSEARYLYVNPKAVSDPRRRRWIVGKTNAEYVESRGLDRSLGMKRDAVLKLVARKKEVLRFDESFPDVDGTVHYYERYVSPVRDEAGNVVRVLGFGLDITDRRLALEALRDSEARQRAILTSALDCIITFDQSSLVLEFNPAAERVFGYRREDIIGRTLPETVIPPDLQQEYRQSLAQYFSSGEDPLIERRVETTALRADGTHFPVELAVVPSRLDDGRYFFTAYVRDITEKIAAERELLKANKIAEQSIRARDLFLANMSHEMRTPISGIIGMTHLLSLTHPTPEQHKYLNAVKFSADTLLVLISDVLDFAKIESGKIEFERFPFRIRDVLRGLVDTLSFQAKEKGLSLVSALDDSLPETLIGDPVRLHQILLNLVGNAIKFTDSGEVSVHAGRAERTLDRECVRFVVSDTGIGISTENQAHIFDRFTQVNGGSGRTLGGAGLGLSIVRELVEGLGGRIEVESKQGAGSAFTVVLPFEEISDAFTSRNQDGAAQSLDISLRGSKILVVEDNEINRFVIRCLLEKWGACIEVAGNGHRALEFLREQSFDLVLMDIQMPEMDGYDTARAIRRDLGLLDLPVLALTASTLTEDRDRITDAGMNDLIFKPFDPNDLRLCIACYLGKVKPETVRFDHGDSQFVDLAFLQEHSFGRQDFILRMIDLFIHQMPDLLQKLGQAAAVEDWTQVNFLAHKMRSSSRMLGIDSLEQMLQTLEVVSLDPSRRDEVHAWVDRVSEMGSIALEELDAKREYYA